MIAETDYRFTFQAADGTQTQVVISVPPGWAPTPISTPILGGFSNVTNPSQYQAALNAIYASYP